MTETLTETSRETFRPGVVVKPYERLSGEQVSALHQASLAILEDPGVWCYNERAARIFGQAGARVTETTEKGAVCWRVCLPGGLVEEAVHMAPSRVVLGAREPGNRLVLDADEPRVYLGTGSEANVWLETDLEQFSSTEEGGRTIRVPRHRKRRGTAELLARAAHLCEGLDHVDFFIRPLNIQDEDVDADNHDVNKFFASLDNITKHVQAGLTTRERLGDVLSMAERIAGGGGALRENPVISFIACLFKSPLQIVADTADKVFDILDSGLPIVLSSSPQGGSSAPIAEAGMVAQINAELLASIALTQLYREGSPVIYGSVPVRARLDNLHDLYGCPEFNQYGIDCVQMARSYRLPCYSSAGVGDAAVPGMQAMFEKMLTHSYMTLSGAQYIHYSFGLLDRTNTFSPLQAVIDDEQVGQIKHGARQARFGAQEVEEGVHTIRKVMATANRLFARHARKSMHRGELSSPYLFETSESQDRVIEKALERLAELEGRPRRRLDKAIVDDIYDKTPGLLDRLR